MLVPGRGFYIWGVRELRELSIIPQETRTVLFAGGRLLQTAPSADAEGQDGAPCGADRVRVGAGKSAALMTVVQNSRVGSFCCGGNPP